MLITEMEFTFMFASCKKLSPCHRAIVGGDFCP